MKIIIETKDGKELEINNVDAHNLKKFRDWYNKVSRFPIFYSNTMSVNGTNSTMTISYREISYFRVEEDKNV